MQVNVSLENKNDNALSFDQPSLFNTCSTLPSGTPEGQRFSGSESLFPGMVLNQVPV